MVFRTVVFKLFGTPFCIAVADGLQCFKKQIYHSKCNSNRPSSKKGIPFAFLSDKEHTKESPHQPELVNISDAVAGPCHTLSGPLLSVDQFKNQKKTERSVEFKPD